MEPAENSIKYESIYMKQSGFWYKSVAYTQFLTSKKKLWVSKNLGDAQ